MKRLLHIVFLLIFASCFAYDSVADVYLREAQARYYVYNLAYWCVKHDQIAKMYADAIMRYTQKYGLRSDLIAKQILRESFFDYRLVSHKNARGAPQIIPFPEHDKLFKLTEKYNDTVPVIDQYHWIYPSIEVMCMIMSNLQAKYISYEMALIGYWAGENSAEMKGYLKNKFDFEKTEYYKYILIDGYIEKYVMGM